MNFRVDLLPKQGWRTHSEHGGLKKKAVSLQSIFSIDTSRGVVPRARVVEKMSLAIRPRGCVFLSPGVIVLYGKKYRDNSRYSEHAHVTQRSFLFRRFQEEKNAHTHTQLWSSSFPSICQGILQTGFHHEYHAVRFSAIDN